jgi:hypothetical protein
MMRTKTSSAPDAAVVAGVHLAATVPRLPGPTLTLPPQADRHPPIVRTVLGGGVSR